MTNSRQLYHISSPAAPSPGQPLPWPFPATEWSATFPRTVDSLLPGDRRGAGGDVRALPGGPAHLGIGGFSDGASYALSLGLTNGDLFSHILAFSPGFLAPAGQHGTPAVYISHGTRDTVLPIDRCSRRIVPRLKSAGYEVLYQEFDGPHTVPPEIGRAAVRWFTPPQAI